MQKLISKVDQLTNMPVFKSIQISLACQACIDAEKTHECLHMMHLVPLPTSTLLCLLLDSFSEQLYYMTYTNTTCVVSSAEVARCR